MKKSTLFLTSAAAGLLALGLAVTNKKNAVADEGEKEKCYGVAAAGKNDCSGAGHSCAGHAAQSGGSGDWVFVPKGLCERLNGGSLAASAAPVAGGAPAVEEAPASTPVPVDAGDNPGN